MKMHTVRVQCGSKCCVEFECVCITGMYVSVGLSVGLGLTEELLS